MKQGTLFYDRKSGRYNFHYVDEDGDRRITAASIVGRSLSKTKRKSKMSKYAI